MKTKADIYEILVFLRTFLRAPRLVLSDADDEMMNNAVILLNKYIAEAEAEKVKRERAMVFHQKTRRVMTVCNYAMTILLLSQFLVGSQKFSLGALLLAVIVYIIYYFMLFLGSSWQLIVAILFILGSVYAYFGWPEFAIHVNENSALYTFIGFIVALLSSIPTISKYIRDIAVK